MGGRAQKLSCFWGFLMTVFTLEFNLFYFKVNPRTCSHENCQPSLFSEDLKTQTPKEHSAVQTFTVSQYLLTSQTHLDGNMKSPAKRANVWTKTPLGAQGIYRSLNFITVLIFQLKTITSPYSFLLTNKNTDVTQVYMTILPRTGSIQDSYGNFPPCPPRSETVS